MKLERSSAILMHITSLPSKYGIGDMGESAYKFIDFLQESGHRYWQLLPLNPTAAEFNHSPYSSYSAFAGNPLLISPNLLEQDGLLTKKDLKHALNLDEQSVEFDKVYQLKYELLNRAYKNFSENNDVHHLAFFEFSDKNKDWLEDYALYLTLKNKFKSNWAKWPEKIRDRDGDLIKNYQQQLSQEIEKEKFIQYIFFLQWQRLVDYAHENNIGFVGDIPFYVNHDSADCWSHMGYFKLDKKKMPTKVSGVPPDYFSETGQLWGTPVYDWKALQENNFDWWLARLRQNLRLFDIVRLDHFRAFSAYWEVPVKEETAINGKWTDVPGEMFFKAVEKEFPNMPFIAEDLGELDQPVYDLLKAFDFPIMKVLQFAFGENMGTNPYILHNHIKNSVAFTGTHDNNTTVGWFQAADKKEKERVRQYIGYEAKVDNIHKIMHRMVLMSVSDLAIVPIQDVLGLDEKAIMNRPGTSDGNWMWRLLPDQLPLDKTGELLEMNIRYGRFKIEKKDKPKAKKKKV